MVPQANIVAWRATVSPWVDDSQVEQDLVLSRAIVNIFDDDWLRAPLACRGGTILHKCLLAPAARYSNDLDRALRVGPTDPERIRMAFLHYMQSEAGPLRRRQLEQTLAAKMDHEGFLGDTPPLLRPGVSFDPVQAYLRVISDLIAPLPDVIVP